LSGVGGQQSGGAMMIAGLIMGISLATVFWIIVLIPWEDAAEHAEATTEATK
jgi:hypothetical protein